MEDRGVLCVKSELCKSLSCKLHHLIYIVCFFFNQSVRKWSSENTRQE